MINWPLRLHELWVGDIGFGLKKTGMGDINLKEIQCLQMQSIN